MIKKICLKLIKIYQFFSKMTPANCRFEPTCSRYTYLAIERFGILKGIWFGTKRLLRCNPKHKGGEDYLPLNIKGEKKWVF